VGKELRGVIDTTPIEINLRKQDPEYLACGVDVELIDARQFPPQDTNNFKTCQTTTAATSQDSRRAEQLTSYEWQISTGMMHAQYCRS
jgi:hypothetical protein